MDFVTDTLIHVRAHGFDAIEVDPAAEEKWTNMVDRWATKAPSFGESSYYFGTNIPGKPRKYLLNSAGRPKLLAEIDKVRRTDYEAFRLSRRGPGATGAEGPDRAPAIRQSQPASAGSPRFRAAAAAAR